MNEQQLKEAFMQYLQQKSGAQTQQEFEAYIQQLGENGLQLEYAQFIEMLKQQLVAARKFGGMLNYVGKLRGFCPEGYEMQFFKQGGQICKKCVQKAKMEDGGKTPQNPVDAFKDGRKMKKEQREAGSGKKLLGFDVTETVATPKESMKLRYGIYPDGTTTDSILDASNLSYKRKKFFNISGPGTVIRKDHPSWNRLVLLFNSGKKETKITPYYKR